MNSMTYSGAGIPGSALNLKPQNQRERRPDHRVAAALQDRPETSPTLVGPWRLLESRAAFTVNPVGTFGNSGRNMFYGPGFASVDWALKRVFHPVEWMAVQFRAETFNAFNRPNLENPVNTLWPNVMTINSAFDPRILQFAMRLKW